jgi:hypothetical protein
MLKKFIHKLGCRYNRSDREVTLRVRQDIANQERLAGILLPDDYYHGGFTRINLTSALNDVHTELSNLKIERHPY